MKVLISYGHDEYSNLASRLKADLEKENIKVWLDKNQITPGSDWEYAIERGIGPSDWIVLLMTRHSVRRPDGVCLDEISVARYLGKNILPIMVQDVRPPLSVARIHPLNMLNCVIPNEDGGMLDEKKYQEKKDGLLDVLTGRRELSYDDAWSAVHGALDPLDNDVYTLHSQKKFYERQKVMNCYDMWYKSNQRLLWLVGDAGAGKTTFVENICNNKSEICSIHFCKYYDNERANPKQAIMSLAYYLSTQIPAYESELMYLRDLDKDRLLEKSAGRLFDYLFVEPLNKIPYEDSPIVMVVDALDEATVNAKNELAEIISRQFEDTPKWLRLVITSRKEELLECTLSQYIYNQVDLNDSKMQANKDIRGFLEAQLIDFLPSNNAQAKRILGKITNNSAGSFLYANEMVDDIKKGTIDISKPDVFPEGLTGIYKAYFSRSFGDEEEKIEKYQKKIRPVMEVLCATSEPLSESKICKILSLEQYDFQDISESICEMFPNRTGTIAPIHKSIIDWLVDFKKSGPYGVATQKGHEKISGYYLKRLDTNDKDDIDYAVKYLCNHLIQCGNFESAVELLCDPEFILIKRMEVMKLDSTVRTFLSELKEIYQNSFQDAKRVFSSPVFKILFTKHRKFFYNSGLYFELKGCDFGKFLESYDFTPDDESEISVVNYYYITESFDQAIRVAEAMFDYSATLSEAMKAELFNVIALCYRKQVKFKDASGNFTLAFEKSDEINDYYNASIALINLGKIAYHELNWDNAGSLHEQAIEYLRKELESDSDSDYRDSLGLFLAEYHRLTAEYLIWRKMLSEAEKELETAQSIYEQISTRDRYYIRFLYTSSFKDLLAGRYQDVYDNCDGQLQMATSRYDKSQILFYKASAAYKLKMNKECVGIIKEAYQFSNEISAWLEMEEILTLNSLVSHSPLQLKHSDLYQSDELIKSWLSYVKDFLISL